ncbi:beta-ketoacyl synthase N-terminal-like domain-containing protein [Flammeovirga aprica]|uniref:Beta-ketoacyl synthase-like N-terminal domain-containing protein n=1 Tax=Flammeovirga aprica JL-4 TaxID=694437 RepID=A0A7X9RQ85_9BACT|nr:beta-ketoacyl synthase N-terminal-like domain-containing protein [Flammeovirga aprica]NME66513.1 hypothetical protein [Flammeovirga aprica JL-4]
MKTYINGVGLISTQETFKTEFSLQVPTATEDGRWEATLPPIKEYLSPKVYRRMSKVIRMGVLSTLIAMEDAGVKSEELSGVIVGTGLGCLVSTEKFLNSMVTSEESMVNPSSFIVSTHNTIAGQIGLVLKNNGYNTTYSQEGTSFENALLDGFLFTKERKNTNWLVGGIDELTPTVQQLYKENNYGGQWGEGAGVFIISDQKSESTYAEIVDVKAVLQSDESLNSTIDNFLQENEINKEDIDLVLTGDAGNEALKLLYAEARLEVLNFKKWSGEYHTASSFGVGLAAKMMKDETLRQSLLGKGKVVNTVLVHTTFFDGTQGLILLRNV